MNATPEQKAKLRKIKVCPSKVKEVVYAGNKGGPGPAMQFHADVRLYGLWEALLYVEGYEADGVYEPETASRAVNAALFPELEDEE